MADEVDTELAMLVRSLDDLDAELAAGDLDPADYETLRNDYTVRVADAVRRRNLSGHDDGEVIETETATDAAIDANTNTAAAGSGSRRLVVLVALGLFAVGAGWLLARSAGERGIGEALTGSVDQSARQRVAACQNLGTVDGDLLAAIQCFDEVLATDPENVEALTYRAWYLVLASSAGSSGSVDDGQEVELLAAAEVYLDQAIELDPAYADARAFRTVVADRQGQEDEVCRQVEALLALDPPAFFVEQTAPVAERNGCR